MSFELGLQWVIHGALALILVGTIIATSRNNYLATLAYRFGTRIELPLATDAIASAARRRIRQDNVAIAVGGLAGVLISAIVVALNPLAATATTTWLITLPLTLTGISAGGALVAVRESLFRRQPDVVRLARPITVNLGDYVSPRRRRTPAALLLAAVALCLIGFALGFAGRIDADTFIRSVALPTLAIAIVVNIIVGLLARQVLRQAQPASSELELAWDDAFRAETFRALWMFGSIIGWLAISAAGLGMLQALDALGGTGWALSLGSQLFNWGFLAVLVTFSIPRAHSHFRFRLWSDLSLVGTP